MRAFTVVIGAAVLMASVAFPISSFAETTTESNRIENLETRLRELETRMANLEASTHKQMGMMQHGMQGQKPGMAMGMRNPMGQVPQPMPKQNEDTGSGMPQAGAQQQQGGAMPMGDM